MWEDAIPIERLVHGERTGRPTGGDDLRRESGLRLSGHDRSARRLVASAPLARPLPPSGPMVDVGEGAAEHAPQPCESDRYHT